MTREEFSNSFDVLLNSYKNKPIFGDSFDVTNIALDEYEKSVFLTKAQEEVVVNLYNGKNIYGDSFESTEEIRRYLDSLVKTKVYYNADKIVDSDSEESPTHIKLSDSSIMFALPEDIAFITLEQIKYSDESLGCANGSIASVYPVTHDEYEVIKNNPFRGPTKYKAIRIDYGEKIVELISKYNIGEYLIKYLSKPKPIVLEDLPDNLSIEGQTEAADCELNPILHNTILTRAVQLAVVSRGSKSE